MEADKAQKIENYIDEQDKHTILGELEWVRSLIQEEILWEKEVTDKLKKYGIACSTIDYIDELDKEIIDLLAKHRLERKIN